MTYKKFPIHPANPQRVCWGCDRYCPADSMACGNGSERTQHPMELFGDDWATTGLDPFSPSEVAVSSEGGAPVGDPAGHAAPERP